MSAPAVTLRADTTLRTAATVLRRHDIGAVAVVGAGGLVGVLSERDLVQSLADGTDPDRTTVRDAMTDTPRPIEADSPLWAAAMLMLRHGVRHLPVTEDDRVVGMLSIREALAVMEHDRIIEPHDIAVGGPHGASTRWHEAVRPWSLRGTDLMLVAGEIDKETAMGTIDGRTWMRIISQAECWTLLDEAPVGRLGVMVDSAPEIYPVNHMVDDNTIVFRTDPGTKLAGLAKSPAVCFQIDGIDPDGHRGWSVLVKGRATRCTIPTTDAASRSAGCATGPSAPSTGSASSPAR